MKHLVPSNWVISSKGMPSGADLFGVSGNLAELQEILVRNPHLRDALEACGVITPDIIIARTPESDEVINSEGEFIAQDDQVARFTPLRARNQQRPILHASISCRWTLRGDRAQNTRTEALNLIRYHEGGTTRTMVVTFEPLVNRLALIALGAGDVDCTYHVALPELAQAVAETGNEAHIEQLQELVNRRRLRDISDLPLDLAA